MHTQRLSFGRSFLGAVAVTVLVLCGGTSPAWADAPPVVVALDLQPGPAGDGFEPVGQVPAQEQLPAAPMVMAAYAVVWVLTAAFVISVWRRLDKVERELRDVEQRVAQEARRK